MKILIIGNGGREHAFAWKVAQSPQVSQVFVAPGNAGSALEAKTTNVNIPVLAIPELITFAKDNSIDLTIVGPEAPLAAGIVDAFSAADLHCFGPSQAAAQLESSKTFSKEFMQKHGIPTAKFASFTDLAAAKDYIKQQGAPIVVKADGLAAGKGVIVAFSTAQALAAVESILGENAFGAAGSQVVIEEFLEGEEASFIVVSDGKNILPLATSQDHKARDNGDAGPNTGGMGAYSPAPIVSAAMHTRIMHEVIEPTVNGMVSDGIPYVGFLYAGIMISPTGEPKVLEFNCRFGDPETQPILMRLNSDLIDICTAALEQNLATIKIDWDPRAALGVVLTAGGYPGNYAKDKVIHGLSAITPDEVKIFHAGTRQSNGDIVTAGGRVLCVTALGETVTQAQQQAYTWAKKVCWDDIYYRTDIGHRAVNLEAAQ